MSDVARQTGRTSVFVATKETTAGTYVAPNNIGRINTTTFDLTFTANTEKYKTLTGSLDSESETREGIADLMAKVSFPFRGRQGMAIIKAAFGQDIRSGSSPVSLGSPTGGVSLGATTFTLATPLPALPAGVSDWVGFFATWSGGNQEQIMFLPGTTGTTVNCSALTGAHLISETLSIAVQHCFVPNTSTNSAILDTLSIMAQWGQVAEVKASNVFPSAFNLKVAAERIDADIDLVHNSLYDYDDVVSTTTNIAFTSAEIADRPFRNQDMALYTYGATADTTVKKHTRLKALDYKMTYALQKEKEGGAGVQSVTINVLSDRTHQVTWTDNAGEAAFKNFRNNFAEAGKTTPAIYGGTNRRTGDSASFYWPVCSVDKYDKVGPGDAVISYNGQMSPLLDATTGVACRMVISSAVTAVY